MVYAPSYEQPLRSVAGKILCLLSPKERELFFPDGFSVPDAEVLDSAEEGNLDQGSLLRSTAPDVVVTGWSTPPFPEELLAELPSLHYICHTAGSVRQLIPRSALEAGMLVTNWGTLAAQAVAEHALLLILSSLRRSHEWPMVIAGKLPWQPSPIRTQTLFGRKIGIHGFGNVGQALVPLLRPFGVSISAFSLGVPQEIFTMSGVGRCDSLEDLFDANDIVVDCEALNASTRGSVTRSVLRRMRPGSLFVNVGRGAVADETALADLAREGRLRVALDVFHSDPIASDSPLHEVDGIVLSPHIAGPTTDQLALCGQLATRNVNAFFRGQPLIAEVTLEIYDRAT